MRRKCHWEKHCSFVFLRNSYGKLSCWGHDVAVHPTIAAWGQEIFEVNKYHPYLGRLTSLDNSPADEASAQRCVGVCTLGFNWDQD